MVLRTALALAATLADLGGSWRLGRRAPDEGRFDPVPALVPASALRPRG